MSPKYRIRKYNIIIMRLSNFSSFIRNIYKDSKRLMEQNQCKKQTKPRAQDPSVSSVRQLTLIFDRKRQKLYEASKQSSVDVDGNYCEALHEEIHTSTQDSMEHVLESTSDILECIDQLGNMQSDYSNTDIAFSLGAALSHEEPRYSSNTTYVDIIHSLDNKVRTSFDLLNRFGRIEPQYLHTALYETRLTLADTSDKVNCLRTTLVYDRSSNNTCVALELLYVNNMHEFFNTYGDHNIGVSSSRDIRALHRLVCSVFRVYDRAEVPHGALQGYAHARFPSIITHLFNDSTATNTTTIQTTTIIEASIERAGPRYAAAFGFSEEATTYIHNNFAYIAAGACVGITAFVASAVTMCMCSTRLKQFVAGMRRCIAHKEEYTMEHSEFEQEDLLSYEYESAQSIVGTRAHKEPDAVNDECRSQTPLLVNIQRFLEQQSADEHYYDNQDTLVDTTTTQTHADHAYGNTETQTSKLGAHTSRNEHMELTDIHKNDVTASQKENSIDTLYEIMISTGNSEKQEDTPSGLLCSLTQELDRRKSNGAQKL